MLNSYHADMPADLDKLTLAALQDAKLPMAQTTSIVIALSLGLWTMIAYAVHLVVW